MTFSVLPDDSIRAGGTTAGTGVYFVTFMMPVVGSPASGSRHWNIPSLPGGNGPGLFPRNGKFVLSELVLVTAVPEPPALMLFAVGLMGMLIVGNQTRKRRTRSR